MARLININYNPLRRSKGAVQEARRSQFLAGDINLAQQGFNLERQSLNLQQRQIDFNRQMIQINTALAVTNAAVGIGKTIGDLHEQKGQLALQQRMLQRERYVEQLIAGGYYPYGIEYIPDTDKDGNPITVENPIYNGFGGGKIDGGRTLADFDKETAEMLEGHFWTAGGKERARQLAENAYLNSELTAQKRMTAKIISEKEAVYQQQVTNAIETARQTGDFTQVLTVIEGSGYSKNRQDADLIAAYRKAGYENALEEAKREAQANGTDGINSFLDNYRYRNEKGELVALNEDQRDAISLEAEKSRKIAVNPRQKELNGMWDIEMGNATPATAGRLINVLESQQDKFIACDNQKQYDYYMGRLKSLLNERGSGGGSSATLADNNTNYMASNFQEWQEGKISALEMWDRNNSLSGSFTTAEERNLYKKCIDDVLRRGGDGSNVTADAFIEFDRLADEVQNGLPRNERDGFQKIKSEMERNLIEMRANQKKPAEMLEYLESMKVQAIAPLLARADQNPNKALSPSEWDAYDEASYEGKLAWLDYAQNDETQVERMRKMPGATALETAHIARNERIITNQLRGTGWEIKGEGYNEEIGKGIKDPATGKFSYDHSGRLFFDVVNPATGEEATVIYNPKTKKLEEVEMKANEDDRMRATGKLSEFDISAKKTEVARRVEERLPDVKIKKINDAMDKAVADAQSPAAGNSPNPRGGGSYNPRNNYDYAEAAIARFISQLENELGNTAKSPEGETYIKAKIEELRKRIGDKR